MRAHSVPVHDTAKEMCADATLRQRGACAMRLLTQPCGGAGDLLAGAPVVGGGRAHGICAHPLQHAADVGHFTAGAGGWARGQQALQHRLDARPLWAHRLAQGHCALVNKAWGLQAQGCGAAVVAVVAVAVCGLRDISQGCVVAACITWGKL
ncbi:hypothetical protein HaLaN_23238 [Haematococcus lacustris]|uniref:Uncharacterized protein n=1 Tax=Haematococcus lacustris TaxID=44745 RepID=A0A699ZZN3_HAELA|nr:hypothetical protein HaLaN_23238 [Haematococcus lacustris]